MITKPAFVAVLCQQNRTTDLFDLFPIPTRALPLNPTDPRPPVQPKSGGCRALALSALSVTMFAVIFLSSLAALFLVYICIPAIWYALTIGDDGLDAHESGLMVVASRKSSASSSVVPVLMNARRKPIPRDWPASKHGQAYFATTQGTPPSYRPRAPP